VIAIAVVHDYDMMRLSAAFYLTSTTTVLPHRPRLV